MEDEVQIFSRIISRDEFNDDYLISMTSDADTQLAAVSVSSINIKNVISTGTPIIAITFIDGHGDLVNVNRLDTEMNYYLYFGKSNQDSSRLPLKISRIDFENAQGGKSEQFAFTVFFVMSNWSELIHQVYNRGWSDIKYSDVVAQIASESGFSDVEVSPSRVNQSFVVQPHWSNLSMLRDLRSKAIPANSTGHYEFGINLDNSFFFLSTEELVQRAIDRFDGREELPLLKLESHAIDQQERKEMTDDNAGIPANFVKFVSSERFMDSVLQGAGGVESQYYDFVNRRFVRTKNTFSSSGEKTLSEWSYIHPSNEKSSLKMYGGRDSGIDLEAQVRVSDVMMSTSMFQIATVGSISYEVGGVVELLIPVPPDKTNTQFNEMYSGFYWVTEIEHLFDLRNGRGSYTTKLTLSRNGLDGKDLSGYVASPGGRIL